MSNFKNWFKNLLVNFTRVFKRYPVTCFFAALLTLMVFDFIITDNNVWSSVVRSKVLPRWEQFKGLKVTTRRTAGGWTADITVPISELKTDRTDLRFNLTRERNIQGERTEYSTWSPLAMLGNWMGVDNYGTLVFLPEKK